MMRFFSPKKRGGEGDAVAGSRKKSSDKKHKEHRSHHKKKHHNSHKQQHLQHPEPPMPQQHQQQKQLGHHPIHPRPKPQKVYVTPSGPSLVDSSAPRKVHSKQQHGLPPVAAAHVQKQQIQPTQIKFQQSPVLQRAKTPYPLEYTVQTPSEANTAANRLQREERNQQQQQQPPPPAARTTFREFLAGIRRNPSSPDNPQPAANVQLPPPQMKQLQKRQPPPPPPPVRSKPQQRSIKEVSKKEVQSKSKLTQSEKSTRNQKNDNKPAEALAFQQQKNIPKSTEKLEETKDPERAHQSSTPSTEKERELEKMKSFVHSVIKKDSDELDTLFDKLRGYIPKVGFTRYLFDENQEKCRFADIICMDQSRVVLEGCAENGFIHASWVQMNKDDFHDRFIISQFPTYETIFDFWHMIWQENITTIINIMTEGEWKEFGEPIAILPETGKCRHVADGFTVTFQKDVSFCDGEYKAVVYGIIHENEYRKLLWINYLGWPEGKCPKDSEAILQLLSLTKTQRRPILVMSMAGAGRAGTYVTLEQAHWNLHSIKSKKLSIFECLQKVRDSRLHSVQTIHQFKFIFIVLIDHIVAVKKIRNDLGEEFMEKYETTKKNIFTKAWEEEKLLSNVF